MCVCECYVIKYFFYICIHTDVHDSYVHIFYLYVDTCIINLILYFDTVKCKHESFIRLSQSKGPVLEKLHPLLEAASFDDLSRITARSALEQFLETPDFTSSSNASEASKILGHLDQLHATLRRVGSRSKEEVFSRQLGRNIKQLQQQAQLQLHTLGVYRLVTCEKVEGSG